MTRTNTFSTMLSREIYIPPNERACNNMSAINWSSATDAQSLEYNLLTNKLHSATKINVDTFACNDEKCCNANHHSDIVSLYMHITNYLFNYGIRVGGANERNHHRTVPSWHRTTMVLNSMQRQEVEKLRQATSRSRV